MLLFQLSDENIKKYLEEIKSVNQDWDKFITSIDEKLSRYGMIHLNQIQEVTGIETAKEKKTALEVEMKVLNANTIDDIVSKLEDVKTRYINQVSPLTNTIDPLELSLIEKELVYMTEKEFVEYYKENCRDKNIVRLCKIELNRRNSSNSQSMVQLQEYEFDDFVTKEINKFIRLYVGLRQSASMSCSFIGGIDETGDQVPKSIPWSTILSEVEHQNIKSNVNVSLKDFIK